MCHRTTIWAPLVAGPYSLVSTVMGSDRAVVGADHQLNAGIAQFVEAAPIDGDLRDEVSEPPTAGRPATSAVFGRPYCERSKRLVEVTEPQSHSTFWIL
jgi:hypothetical protein